ncbi:hypothetical protein AO366_1287 [Moraxella catarrhalis]|nr:hypothetical protein AO366_1287 [Moraxella catarrhalis]
MGNGSEEIRGVDAIADIELETKPMVIIWRIVMGNKDKRMATDL